MVKKTDPRLIFLRARLGELEVAATAAVEIGKIMTKHDDAQMSTVLTWRWGLLSESVVDGRRGAGYSTSYHEGAPSPEAVLADVDSKRRILDAIEPLLAYRTVSPGGQFATVVIVELLRPFQADPAFERSWLA